MSFEQLIADMQIMAKALPANQQAGDDDDKALSLGDDDDDDPGPDPRQSPGPDDDDDDDDNTEEEDEAAGHSDSDGEMTKSFSFTLEDGTQVDAVDGTALVQQLTQRIEDDKGTVLKALGLAVDMLKAQAAQIQRLDGSLKRLSSQGRGRQTALTIVEKSTPSALAKSEPVGLSRDEFFAKADIAQKAGRITAAEICTAEAFLNNSKAVPAPILSRVLG